MTVRLVLLRHGESTWNRANRFTGWTDVPLSDRGVEEARRAGEWMRDAGFEFDLAFTSVLRRAIDTLHLALEVMDRVWIEERKRWRLNERHYGALQGLDKVETARKHGAEQVFVWRRSYDVPPPPLDAGDPRHPRHDPRYAALPPELVPASECLKDVVARVLPWWHDECLPALRAGRQVLVAAHGNSLRALVKHLDQVPDDEIPHLNIPTGFPLVYELETATWRPVRHYYLGDEDAARRAAEAVARQASAPPA